VVRGARTDMVISGGEVASTSMLRSSRSP